MTKLFCVAVLTLIVGFFIRSILDAPTNHTDYQSSTQWSNQDKGYTFTVPNDGQIMRLEIRGTMPMNRWKSIAMDIYDDKENYLFTYTDELWSESGYDSDGRWTEYRKKASINQRFAKAGTYVAFISDSHNINRSSIVDTHTFRFRAVPLHGDISKLMPFLWLVGGVVAICFAVFIFRAETKDDRVNPILSMRDIKTKKTMSIWILIAIFFIPLFALTAWGSIKDDDDINWIYVANTHRNVTVDRDLRQQSLSGAHFRSGGSTGGK
ncbi:hypothetical protein [Flocculibacter collagenilyticus]|uniref:hypothetical protein n=1 Tax=Flocculibacter collagenilyticus TaxID=2744479 RepID=UPI0018F27D16|nr:hypothetical protein [Flocculibacter collagenilyticus]